MATKSRQSRLGASAGLLKKSGGDTAPAPATGGGGGGGIVAQLRGSDGQKRVLTVPLERVAPHPDNPRSSLGDVDQLAASIGSMGLLQPILAMPVATFLSDHPEHRDTVGDVDWVVTAGHRRYAAHQVAMLRTIDLIPHDVDKIRAYATFLAENEEREQLSPLDVARGYQLMADAGESQGAIAQALGVSQGQVSKRLALLKLPDVVQAAVTSGDLPVTEAQVLAAKVPAEDLDDAWRVWLRGRQSMSQIAGELERKRRDAAAVASWRASAETMGLVVVDAAEEVFGRDAALHRITSSQAIEQAEENGAHVVVPTAHGLEHYSAEPVREKTYHDPTQDPERTRAMKARAEAAGRMVRDNAGAASRMALPALRDVTLAGHHSYAACLKLAHQWIGDKAAEDDGDKYHWIENVREASEPVRTWVAWAMAIAAAETAARHTHVPWGSDTRDYIAQLIELVDYQPTAWETARLAPITPTADQ